MFLMFSFFLPSFLTSQVSGSPLFSRYRIFLWFISGAQNNYGTYRPREPIFHTIEPRDHIRVSVSIGHVIAARLDGFRHVSNARTPCRPEGRGRREGRTEGRRLAEPLALLPDGLQQPIDVGCGGVGGRKARSPFNAVDEGWSYPP